MPAPRVTEEMRAEVDDLLRARTGDSPRLRAARAKLAEFAAARIESARRMQEDVYGYDFRAMQADPRQVCDYLTHMALAAFGELNEAMYEWEWKRWTTDDAWFDRDRILDELVDLDMFSDNMKAVLNCTDEEFARRYQAKQAKNRKRMAEGYAQREVAVR